MIAISNAPGLAVLVLVAAVIAVAAVALTERWETRREQERTQR